MCYKWPCFSIKIGIAFECYAPLGSPTRLSVKPDDPVVMEDPVIKELAVKYNASPAQVRLVGLRLTIPLRISTMFLPFVN